MKSITFKTSLILAILFLAMPGCLTIWFTTDVHPDGSIGKNIVFEGDSAEIVDVQLALIKSGDWKKEWSKIEKDKWKMTISKEFKSVNDLNSITNPPDSNLLGIRINSTLQRKFRWFFTRYIYEETILMANPFITLDYRKFLTDEEVRLIRLTDDGRKADPKYDSLNYKKTEKKFENFLFRNMYEDFYQRLYSILVEDKSLTLSKQQLDGNKENIFEYLIDSIKGDNSEDILTGFEKVLHHPDIQVIKSKYLSRFDEFQKKMKFYQSSSDDSYKFNIRMPGLLLGTNSSKIEGSTLNWEVTYYDFYFFDYTMKAESRMVNAWAFIVAGLILLAAIGGFVSLIRKKR